MIAGLYNVPTDKTQMDRFSFYNRDAHVLAIRAVRTKYGVLSPEYPLDPISINDFPNWLYTHQAMHNSINGVLGITGNDLTDVDPRQIDQLTYWIQLHAAEHVQWGNMLGYD